MGTGFYYVLSVGLLFKVLGKKSNGPNPCITWNSGGFTTRQNAFYIGYFLYSTSVRRRCCSGCRKKGGFTKI